MNIAIYDAEHYEGIYPLIKILGTKENRLTIFTSSSSIDRLHEMLHSEFFHHKWIVIEPENRNTKYFKRVKALLKVANAEFVFFNTIATHQYHYAKLIKSFGPENCVVTVHNVNSFFEPSPRVGIKSYFNNIGKKYLRKHLVYFNVISASLLPRMNELLNAEQKVFSIPGGIFENKIAPAPLQDRIRIVIPGMVDQNRRNYDQVFELAQLAENKNLPLEIVVSGGFKGSYAERIKEKIQNTNFQGIKLTCTDFPVVPQPEYDQQLALANYIWLPSTIHFRMDRGMPEIYGVTKSSGNVYDIVRSGKPYLAPTALNMPKDLQEIGFHYQKLEALVQYLLEIHLSPNHYEKIAALAREKSASYNIENIRQQFPTALKHLID